MTRTLWVTNDLPPRAGGIEQFLHNLLARLDPESTRVLASAWPGDEEHDAALEYRVDRVGARPLLPTRGLASRVRAQAEAHGADVVVFGSSWPLGELGDRVAVPTLALTHGHEAGLARVGLGHLVRRVAARVDHLTAISAFTRQAIEPWVGDRAPISHLPPGVDLARFHPGVDGAEVRAHHGIPADAPLAVCISRLVPRKGQDALVACWPAVRDRVPGARLLIVGAGPAEARLRKAILAAGLGDVVDLRTDAPWSSLPAYHRAADVFAMPCRTRLAGLDVEGLGIVYLEAQACGVPVVAGTSGGAPEALLDGRSGRVVDGRDLTGITDAVVAYLRDPDLRVEAGAAGRAFVEAEYDWEVLAGRFREIVGDLARAA